MAYRSLDPEGAPQGIECAARHCEAAAVEWWGGKPFCQKHLQSLVDLWRAVCSPTGERCTEWLKTLIKTPSSEARPVDESQNGQPDEDVPEDRGQPKKPKHGGLTRVTLDMIPH